MRLFNLVLLLAAAGHAATLPIVTAQAPDFPSSVVGSAAVLDVEIGYFTVLTPSVVDLDAAISLQTASLAAPAFNGSSESIVDVTFNGNLLYQFFASDYGYTQAGHNVVLGPTSALGQSLAPGLYTVSGETLDGVGTSAAGPIQAMQIGTGLAGLSLNVISGDVVAQAPEPTSWLPGGLGSLVLLVSARRRSGSRLPWLPGLRGTRPRIGY